MSALVLGSGGREHALALALSRDDQVDRVDVAPGNPGTWELSRHQGLALDDPLWPQLTRLDPLDAVAVVELAQRLGANLVVVGPEAPLVAGVADAVRAAGIDCFGPSAQAARLEGSKQFAKEVMAAAQVPTAGSLFCRTTDEVEAALDRFGAPYVVKDDGLAAGKGVVVTNDRAVARQHAVACVHGCIIEEYLDGPEVSLFAIADGRIAVPLIPAQDFKRVGDGDTGANTGGMGAYAPTRWAPGELTEQVMTTVVDPTLKEMARRGDPFQGLLYVGLALTSRGLKVVEFNVRFGDPETEAILPLLASGLGRVLQAAARGDLTALNDDRSIVTRVMDDGTIQPLALRWFDQDCVAVIEAALGYPGTPLRGGRITLAPTPPGLSVIHCGTSRNVDGELISQGGRVLAVVAVADNLRVARQQAYDYLKAVDFPDGFYRRDIAAVAADLEVQTR
ncbi:MAG: phosphoribosylamine--glycine ligase [Propionibacteriaceae bacterium]|nr:phosphoribosylamine--glycine ligase [Propionibacteriaceae bacterium]